MLERTLKLLFHCEYFVFTIYMIHLQIEEKINKHTLHQIEKQS